MPSDSEPRDVPARDVPARDVPARDPGAPVTATSPMTLVTVIAERILRDRVLDGIRKAGSRGFTLTNVTGEGSRLIHAHEWEGPSVKIETLVPSEVAERIIAMVAERYFEHHAVIVYTSQVQVIRARRFVPPSTDPGAPDQG